MLHRGGRDHSVQDRHHPHGHVQLPGGSVSIKPWPPGVLGDRGERRGVELVARVLEVDLGDVEEEAKVLSPAAGIEVAEP